MTWPALLDLELLIRSDQLGSLSAAARELGLSQPEASRRLARLESDLDLRLLVRTPTGSHLTASGELVAEWSHQLLDQATQWRAGVAALHARASAQLDVAASQTIAEYLAPRWLAQFRATHDGSMPRLEVHNSGRVIELVETGAVALGFSEAPDVTADLQTVVVGRDHLVVVVAPSHPWRRRRSVTIADLASTPLVVREPGSGTRETLERAMEGHECVPCALELGSNAAVLSAAASGAGPAVVSALAVRGAVAEGRLYRVHLTGPSLRRDLRAVWRADSTHAAEIRDFLTLISAT